MQINIATGNAVVHAVQNKNCEDVSVSARKEVLKRRINILQQHLGTYDIDKQTRQDFEEEIAEIEEELKFLN